MAESSFSPIYTITVNDKTIDGRPTTNIPDVNETLLANGHFWWLIGYLQGDGSVDMRNGIWFHSTDRELIEAAKGVVTSLFGLSSSVYLEKPDVRQKPRLKTLSVLANVGQVALQTTVELWYPEMGSA